MSGTVVLNDVKNVQTKKSQISFVVDSGSQVKLLYVGQKRNIDNWFDKIKSIEDGFNLTELQVTGGDFRHLGAKHSFTAGSFDLKFENFDIEDKDNGKLLTVKENYKNLGLDVYSYFRLYDNTVAIRSWKKVINIGSEKRTIDYISSFNYSGVVQQEDYPGNYSLHDEMFIPHNAWTTELQWQKDTLNHLGLPYFGYDYEKDLQDDDKDDGGANLGVYLEGSSSKRISVTNNSSWSCSEYSPNGAVYNTYTNQIAAWQIENNGAWHYEVENHYDGTLLNLQLSGPEEYDNSFWVELSPSEEFTTVPVAFVQQHGDFESASGEMTKYRRNIRRQNKDNEELPVIFNDYMNCLMGNPTTEKEIPLIDAASKIGCEYFVVDCGWYDAGSWWDSVGEWKPSYERFPNGIDEVMDYIRSKGMTAGLWLEPEVMGINCEFAHKVPDNWFFMRNGQRIVDKDRYLLDFRNPDVVDYVTKVVDRLVKDYHVGYIKMDYNVTTGLGTDYNTYSLGKGLLDHNRAVQFWRDTLYTKYPDLVIENCSSGGMRHDYAMLSKDSIQSVSDQTDYTLNAAISSIAASAIAPEQSAIWSYPLPVGTEEETIYNMCNTLLCRIHQSGYLNKIEPNRLSLVAEGIKAYKENIRKHIPNSVPVWPNGLPHMHDAEIVYGLRDGKQLFIAVWNNEKDNNTIKVDLSKYGDIDSVSQVYPFGHKIEYSISNNIVLFNFELAKSARIFKIQLK